MKENEVILGEEKDFAKEYNAADHKIQEGIQEVWNSGLVDHNIEKRAENMKQQSDS